MFIETTGQNDNDIARMTSPELYIKDDSGPHCMALFYHMYGSDIGKLRILRLDTNGVTELFEKTGKNYCLGVRVRVRGRVG